MPRVPCVALTHAFCDSSWSCFEQECEFSLLFSVSNPGAGENLERERFVEHARASYNAGLQFADAKAWLEAANRGAIHLSLVILYSLGGWLVLQGHMPLRVMLTGIGFTFSLMFATQVRTPCLLSFTVAFICSWLQFSLVMSSGVFALF
jgi:ABC-type multidrug transport system fused ATPase/permease subunit